MNSPIAVARASLEAATMPPFSDRKEARMRGSSAVARSIASRTCGSLEQSSTRHSSQSPKLCRWTDFNIAASTSAGVSYTGVRIENRGAATALALPAETPEQRRGRRPDESGQQRANAGDDVQQPCGAGFQLGDLALERAEFGVLADQQVAQPQHLLAVARQLLAQRLRVGGRAGVNGSSLLRHGGRVYPYSGSWPGWWMTWQSCWQSSFYS